MTAWVLLIGLTTGQAEATTTGLFSDRSECTTVAMGINGKALEALKTSPGSTQVRASCAEVELLQENGKSPQAGTNKNE